jgi:zinc protease
MTATRVAGLLAGLCWLGVPSPSPTPRAPVPADADSLTTAYTVAGIQVIQHVNRANDLVAVSLYLLGGTRQISERTAGIEPLLLHAAANGTTHYPDGLSQRAMARTGSVEFLDPTVDWTVVGFVTLRPDVDSAWQVFADRLMHPTLAAEGVRLARDRMLATVRRRYAEPDERIQIIANQVTFVGHPYALDPEGTEQSLVRLRPQDLADYAAAQMVKSRMLMVVVGNMDRARIESLVTTTIGNLPPGGYHWTLPPLVPRQQESHWLIEPRDLPTNYILGYFTGPTAASDDYAAFRVATSLLSSRLFETIRVEKGLSYAAYAPFLERAVAVGGLYASTPKPELVLPMMYDQIRFLQREEIERFDLHQYVNTYVLDYLTKSGTNADLSDFLARAELYLGDYRLTDKYMDRLHRVAPEDVLKAINRYMLNIQWAYLGDTARMAGAW